MGLTINIKDSNEVVCEKLRANYRVSFIDYPQLQYENGWLYGMWMMGNNYKGSGYHGAYPPQYLKRVGAMFNWMPDCLQLFSGSVDKEQWLGSSTLDINPDLHACYTCDAEKMSKTLGGEHDFFSIIVADPPYTEEDANKYGYPMVSRNKVVKECHKILRNRGFLVWLDQAYPMYRKDEWDLIGTIGMIRSTNHRVRTVFIFRKK